MTKYTKSADRPKHSKDSKKAKGHRVEYGLVGKTLKHSFSPQIHSLLGKYSYKLLPMNENKLDVFMKAKRFKGLNVTIPYKQTVIKYCNSLSPVAEEIGSVNTIVKRKDGTLWGHNTDIDGFLYMAKRAGISFTGKKVLICGDGGTSLTAQTAIKSKEAREIVVVSLKGPVTYDNLGDHADADIIVNTTPVGMFPKNGECLVNLDDFPNLTGVLDVVYNPLKTQLILEAEKRNIPCCGGLPMLVGQGKYASEKFQHHKINDRHIERVLKAIKKDLTNIIIIGMPGSGKSTVGKNIGAKLNREFIDLDKEIEKEAGKSIPKIFEDDGEEAFRALETKVTQEFGKRAGIVISTGGGTILREENVAALRQNGIVILLERPLKFLATKGRPLSKDEETLREMEKTRRPYYEAAADCILKNSNGPREVCQEGIRLFYENLGN